MGYYQSAVYGLKFARSDINAYESIDCNVSQFLPLMLTPRSMHQSCIVKSKAGFWTLLTIGGRYRD